MAKFGSIALLAVIPFHAALAQVAPPLGTAQSFAVLGASAVTNTGPTVVTGDLGVSPGSAITGFPPGVVVGTIHAADAVALQAQNDTTTAYNNLAGQACDTTFGPVADIGGLTLVPGVYCFPTSVQITGTVTLDAGGDPNAVWVFKVGSTLVTASNANVLLVNGAQNCNVFWQIGSSATIGTNTTFVGNMLALASITLNTNATVAGRAFARTGAVTMDSNQVAASSCAIVPVTPLPPTIGKSFSPATIPAGGTSTLTITLSNPDPTSASLTLPFTDNLPAGVVAIAGTATNTCGGIASNNASSVTLTGGSIAGNSSCTLSVQVTAANGGNYIDLIPAGALHTSNGSNANPAAATLTVPLPPNVPTIGKAFSLATIPAGGTSILTVTLTNTDSTAATLTQPFTDTLPVGLTAVAGSAANTCGGIATNNANSVTLTGGAIPANSSCTLSVTVMAANGGNYTDTIPIGALQTSNGNNPAPAVATLTVIPPVGSPPTIGKEFSPSTIAAGGTSTLTITLSNNNTSAAMLLQPFTDNLPVGLVAVAGSAANTCGGVATNNASSVTLTGGSIPISGSCVVTVVVNAPNGGNFIDTIPIGALVTSNGNNPAPASATLTVAPPPAVTLGKAFSPATIPANGTSILTITLSNSGSLPATLTAPLVDTLPAGVVVADSANPSTTCGGTVTAPQGSSTVTLNNGTIPAGSFCVVRVRVTAAVAGSYFDTLPAGALQTNHGNNTAPAVATLTVVPVVVVPPMIKKEFCPDKIKVTEISTLVITLKNSNSTPALMTAPLVDHLPKGLVIVGYATSDCGGTVDSEKWGSTITLTGGTIPAHGSCTVKVDVASDCNGYFHNKLPIGALQTNQGSNLAPAEAALKVSCDGKVCARSVGH